MKRIIAVASGKGGVGKTLLTASLGYELAAMGKTVLLVDLDLGASNLHSCIGVPNNNPGIGNFIHGSVKRLDELIVATSYPRLYFIPGDQMLPGTTNFPFYVKQRIIKQIHALVADYILLDLGAGSAFNTVDFFLAAGQGLIVTTSEPTSILNAYAFLKTVLYRGILRSFPRKSPQRNLVQEYMSQRIEGTSLSIPRLIRELGGFGAESQQRAQQILSNLHCAAMVNMARGAEDVSLGGRLRQVSAKNLGISLEYIGLIPFFSETYRSILAKTPCSAMYPDTDFAAAVRRSATNINARGDFTPPELFDAEDDIDELKRIYEAAMAAAMDDAG